MLITVDYIQTIGGAWHANLSQTPNVKAEGCFSLDEARYVIKVLAKEEFNVDSVFILQEHIKYCPCKQGKIS